MGWLIALGILILIGIIPVGVKLVYHADGLFLSLLVSAIQIRLYPKRKDKKKQSKKNKKPKKKESSQAKKTPAPEKKKSGGKLTDFLPLVETAISFLGSFRRKLRVDRLEADLILASDDPCDLALNYGKAWTAVGNLMPLLERIFVIRKRDIRVQCDFTADSPTIRARLDITITIGRLLWLVLYYGIKIIVQYFQIKKRRS